MTSAIAVAAMMSTGGSGLAQPEREWPSARHGRTMTSHDPAECTCRAAGVSHAIGAEICLGGRLVRCAMDLNVTSWQKTETPCPES